MVSPQLDSFRLLCEQGYNVIPLVRRLFSDQLTPVLAYRRLVSADERTAPSFLLESVENGDQVGRHSFLGAQPAIEIVARGNEVAITNHRTGERTTTHERNPLEIPRRMTTDWRTPGDLESTVRWPAPSFTGGWVGYAGYDSVRYLEPDKLPFACAPPDDRALPDLHFGLYRQVAVFDHVDKLLYAISNVITDEHDSIEDAYRAGVAELDEFVMRLEAHSVPLPAGSVDAATDVHGGRQLASNFTRPYFEASVDRCKQYIAAGDAFQIVISQRFERQTTADPFEIYRALRVVNPSPYMIYLQAAGSILVASSPEILCRVDGRTVTNRPLAGTRKRGVTEAEDMAMEEELQASEKDRAEHVMLVDLGRNDLGRVCEVGTIELEKVLEVERYSHVMHLSSTVTGALRDGADCWDALRHTLPVGTVSGAPKVRAMQIIDELEPTKRGPYAGGIGLVSLRGDMDIAIALRTMVVPTASWDGDQWTVHLQAGAGIVADSVPADEYDETVNKAAALSQAIDLAEAAFGGEP